MPKPGGTSGKLGDLYEALWTVETALDVFEGRLRSITAEAFGEESQGVEFHVVMNSGTSQFHSAKRQKVGGDWSIADLCYVENKKTGRSILGDLLSKQSQWPGSETCFVSATGANELRELTEQAKTSKSSSDFREQLSKQLGQKFDKYVVPLCSGDVEAALAALKTLRVRLRDHSGLVDTIERRLDSLLYRLDGSELRAGDVRRLIAEHIVENLGQTITTAQLRQFIQDQDLGLRDWKVDATVRESVEKANERYRDTTEAELINDAHIPRDAVQGIVTSLAQDDSRGALVVAPGGFGKSCILAQCLEQLSQRGTPYLCLRMDSFNPCRTAKQLGDQMDLPESPAKVLAAVADSVPSVLVIDQLDAMSLVSGRNPQMWDVFEQVVREAQSYPHIKVLLACRDFDLNHDHRLRSLGSEKSGFTKHVLSLLSPEEVKASLAKAHLGQLTLPEPSIQILKVPFHLLLFLQGDPSRAFATAAELYDRYWDRKRQKLRDFLGRAPRWNEVLDALTERMSERQLLFAPIASVGSWADDAKAMASEHVLIEATGQRQYRFFHESFFDYAYARRFCETAGDVIKFLESSEQHLFRRAQVRQILAYRRENDFHQYINDVVAIFSSPKVRFHIKRMVASGFRRLEEPTPEEWEILEPHVLDGDLSRYVSTALRDHVGWFDLLTSLGVFKAWLASGDSRFENAAIWYLESHDLHNTRSAQIARMVAAYAEQEGEWQTRMMRIMSWGQAHKSPEMTAIYLELIKRGAYDDYKSQVIGSDFWGQHHNAEKESPQFVIDVLATWFDRTVNLFDDGSWNFFDKCVQNKSHSGSLMVCKAASDAPEYFVEHMLPRVRSVVLRTAEAKSGELYDRAWPWLSNIGEPFDINDAVLLSLRKALQHLAVQDPAEMRRHAVTISQEPHRTFAYLLLRAWTENPQQFANECAAYLIADKRRLNIGYSGWSYDGQGTGKSAISRMALKAISSCCSTELLASLESAIVGYCGEYEKTKPQRRGSSELLRLRSLDPARISRSTKLRIEELERKFPRLPDAIVSEDKTQLVKQVDSPLSLSIAEKMTDRQWISAMRKYDGTTDSFRGGSIELSRMLRDFVRTDRKRFAALIVRIPNDIDPDYFSAILDGLCSRHTNLGEQEKPADDADVSSLPTALFFEAIERIHALPSRPCGSAIVGCIQKLAGRALPTRLLEIVSFYAIHDPDPIEDIWRRTDDRVDYNSGGPYSHGINCVRGQAAECLGTLLFADEKRLELLRPALMAISADPVISVRTCAINALLPLLNFERDFAVELFLIACNRCDAICATPPFDRFAHFAVRTHYAGLRELLQFALSSNQPEAVENAARRVTLAELSDVDVGNDAAAIRAGDETTRKTAADVYATNIADDEVGDRCAGYLKDFFNDESEAVRQTLSRAFFKLSGPKLLHFNNFIAEYIECRSFENETDRLLHALNESNVELPQVICRAAERILEFIREDGTHIAYRGAMVAREISTLVVRQYEQTKDESIKTRCLDLIDRMERVGYYGIAEELGKLDR